MPDGPVGNVIVTKSYITISPVLTLPLSYTNLEHVISVLFPLFSLPFLHPSSFPFFLLTSPQHESLATVLSDVFWKLTWSIKPVTNSRKWKSYFNFHWRPFNILLRIKRNLCCGWIPQQIFSEFQVFTFTDVHVAPTAWHGIKTLANWAQNVCQSPFRLQEKYMSFTNCIYVMLITFPCLLFFLRWPQMLPDKF